jgi:hypothetical protein
LDVPQVLVVIKELDSNLQLTKFGGGRARLDQQTNTPGRTNIYLFIENEH